jgi:hypothetical protein
MNVPDDLDDPGVRQLRRCGLERSLLRHRHHHDRPELRHGASPLRTLLPAILNAAPSSASAGALSEPAALTS